MEANNPPEPNPFEAPQATSPPAQSSRGRTLKRAVLVLLAIVLTPIAAGIGGFCCCLGGLVVGDMLGDTAGGLGVAGFGLGILLGATGVIYATHQLLKRVDGPPRDNDLSE